jgi:hypothetical protein
MITDSTEVEPSECFCDFCAFCGQFSYAKEVKS